MTIISRRISLLSWILIKNMWQLQEHLELQQNVNWKLNQGHVSDWNPGEE